MSNTVQNINSIAPMGEKNKESKPKDPVQAEYEAGKRFLENGELAQAAVALHNALLGFEEKNDETGIANASNQLGHACLAREEFDKAASHYQRAYEICEKLEDPISLQAISKKMVAVHQGLKEYDKAIELCLDLLDVYYSNNDPRGAVVLLEDMAAIYVEAGKPAKAADAYRTVASIHRNFKHKSIAEEFEDKAAALDKAV